MRQNKQKGFTLIEILVVVVIVAVLMGAVTLSFPPSDDKLLKEHTDRFAALVSMAQDEAILQSRVIGLYLKNDGYLFKRNDNNQWTAYTESPFKQRKYPAQLESTLYIDGIALDLEDREKNNPHIVINPSGEITAFNYKLKNEKNTSMTLKFSPTGDVVKELAEDE